MSQVDEADIQDQKQIVEQEDPQYEVDSELVQKQRQLVYGEIFCKLLQGNLTKLSRIFDGTSYAFTKLDLVNKRLFSLNRVLTNYPHLREINLKNNFLTEFDYALLLKYLIKIDLSNNKIQDIRSLDNPELLPFLEELNLSENKIKRLVKIPLRRIKILKVNSNEIQQIQFEGNDTLEVLQLRDNKIKNLSNLSKMPKLKQLYLAQNQIQDITTLKDLPSLELLHLRKNKVQNIVDKVLLPQLQKLNLRQNNISKIQSIEGLPNNLRNLNILTNPLSEELGDNTKKQIWMLHRHYFRINKNDIQEQQKIDFDKQYKDRLQELERLRLEKQQQQRQQRQQAERIAAQKQAEQKAARQAERLEREQQEKQRIQEQKRLRQEQQQQERKKLKQQEKPEEEQEEQDQEK